MFWCDYRETRYKQYLYYAVCLCVFVVASYIILGLVWFIFNFIYTFSIRRNYLFVLLWFIFHSFNRSYICCCLSLPIYVSSDFSIFICWLRVCKSNSCWQTWPTAQSKCQVRLSYWNIGINWCACGRFVSLVERAACFHSIWIRSQRCKSPDTRSLSASYDQLYTFIF